MRICLYTATFLPKLGGQEAVVDSLARHFKTMGHEPVVLAPRPRSPLHADDATLPYPVVRHPRFFSTRDFVSWYRFFLSRAHALNHFEVIHCHDVYPTGYLAGLSKDKLHVPIVITSHGGDIREHNPRLMKGKIPQRCVAALRAADALISIGPFTERGFRRLYPQAGRIVTIPNGIDLVPYADSTPRPEALDPAIKPGQYLLFLGRLAHRKGVDLLIQAFALTNGARLVVAGSGEEQGELQSLAAALGVADRINFVGRVEGAIKIHLLQNSLCTVMPSRVWEAFPLVLLESFAAGRPVLGTRVPGIIDLVEHGRTGMIVAEDDVSALAAAMQQMTEQPNETNLMGKAAREVAQSYSWEAVARMHLDLYQSLQTP